VNVHRWKDVGNEMMMRKAGRLVDASPGKNYGLIKNLWEKWMLYKFEEIYPNRPLPEAYSRPAVETKKRVDPIAALREQLGVKTNTVKSPNDMSGTVSPALTRTESSVPPSQPSIAVPPLPSLPQMQPLPALPELTREQRLHIRMSKSRTYDRGLRLDEVAVRKIVDLQFRQKMEDTRYRQDPLGQDRYKSRYWVHGDDWSALWIEQCAPDGSRSWGCYTSIDKVDELVSRLDSYGARECALRDVIELNRDRFEKAMSFNHADMMDVDAESDEAAENGVQDLQCRHQDIVTKAARVRDWDTLVTFEQNLYGSDPNDENARAFFGIDGDMCSASATSFRITAGLAKLKGDLLLLELGLQASVEEDWHQGRKKWLQCVRDSKTATELDDALESLISSVDEGVLQPWYHGIPR